MTLGEALGVLRQEGPVTFGDDGGGAGDVWCVVCGVMITLGMSHRTWSGGSGSMVKTSNAAPAMSLARSASTSPSWSTVAPRPMLTK